MTDDNASPHGIKRPTFNARINSIHHLILDIKTCDSGNFTTFASALRDFINDYNNLITHTTTEIFLDETTTQRVTHMDTRAF